MLNKTATRLPCIMRTISRLSEYPRQDTCKFGLVLKLDDEVEEQIQDVQPERGALRSYLSARRSRLPPLVVDPVGSNVSSAPAGPPPRAVDDGQDQAALPTQTSAHCSRARSAGARVTSSTSPGTRWALTRARWRCGGEAFSRANHSRGRRRNPGERIGG